MVAPKKGSKEETDAQAAKKKADPAVNDPKYMPNIDPQEGDSGKKDKAPALNETKADVAYVEARVPTEVEPGSGKSKLGGVTLDPNLPLIPGNAVNFVAREAKGDATAIIEDARNGARRIRASNSGNGARVNKIIETYDPITITFYEDGKAYASGTFGK